MSRVVVGLSPALAAELAHATRSRAHRGLRRALASAGAELTPQGLRSLDEDIVWFSADAGSASGAQSLVHRLLAVPGVRAAYVSAPEGPPTGSPHAPAGPASPPGSPPDAPP